ncbi:MAG: hypothetical protein EP317_03275 [Bacillota bacterium]|nr:MAG: hypothetical protein EP317_03275 [Bacillota bacterium]
MKFSIHDLKEKTSIDFICDFKNEILQTPDILSIEPAYVTADIRFANDELYLQFKIDCHMILACSKTLKPVPYHMQFEETLIFGDDEDSDFPLTDPLELGEVIYGLIISEKPYTIYHPDAKDVTFEKEKSPHPAFAELDKTYKK